MWKSVISGFMKPKEELENIRFTVGNPTEKLLRKIWYFGNKIFAQHINNFYT